jgi:hypothetical protein
LVGIARLGDHSGAERDVINHPHRAKKTTQAAAATSAASTATTEKPARRRRMAPAPEPAHNHDYDYANLLTCVEQSRLRASENGPLFTTDAAGLVDKYLFNLAPGERQTHNCRACQRFIETYGGLVAISELGVVVPAMWNGNDWPQFYQQAVDALHYRVRQAKVTGPFLSSLPVWGTPESGIRPDAKVPWTHLSAYIGTAHTFRETKLTAEQAMAAKREDFRTVQTFLDNTKLATLAEALRMLTTESLPNSERFVAPVRWLVDLYERRVGVRSPRVRDNILWKAVASAPDGFCHPNASMVGVLVENIEAGRSFKVIVDSFGRKVDPRDFQRPKAPPAAGNIRAGEAIIEKLGLGRSLVRRFARLDDLQKLWTPRRPKRDDRADAMNYATAGVFGHLTPKEPGSRNISPPHYQTPQVEIPPVIMTWVKFAATVLPTAEHMEFLVPGHGHFIAFTTAVHGDSPPLMKWDGERDRNPVAWYVYPAGSTADRWNLKRGWCPVTAVALLPTMWGKMPMPFLGEGAVLVLDGARDMNHRGGMLFPECLRGELHEISSTIEAYSGAAQLYDQDKATACGYDLRKGADYSPRPEIRVWSANRSTRYVLDRWD